MGSAEPVDDQSWAFARPLGLLPVRASETASLTGRSLLIHDPVVRGWTDLFTAASERHDIDGVAHVGIVSTLDWHRHRVDPATVLVPRAMRLDRVWVEEQVPALHHDPSPEMTVRDQADAARWQRSMRLVDPATPPVRTLLRASTQATVHGRRAAYTRSHTPRWPLRVLSEPWWGELSDVAVDMTRGLEGLSAPRTGSALTVCTEDDWWAWHAAGTEPASWVVSTFRVWVI